jgi:transposase-like protein
MLRIGATQRYVDPLAAGINDLQEMSKTREAISKAKTQTWHRTLTHYLPLYFPEIERFAGNSRSTGFWRCWSASPHPENADAGLAALEAFEEGHWCQKYPSIAQSWRRHWEQVIPFFSFSAPIRRMIYTTNAIEALNSKLRRAVRTRGHFPGDEAAMKLLYLVVNHAVEQWKRPPRKWTEAKTQFAIIFGDRFTL